LKRKETQGLEKRERRGYITARRPALRPETVLDEKPRL
jgi:hypothetical protein